MGKLVVTEFISLDGVMEDPGGAEQYRHGGWTFKFDQGPDGPGFKFAELQAADAQLLGRVTYEGFAKAWPAMDDNPFGQKMNAMPKFVVSTTLERPEWNNTSVLKGGDDLVQEADALKRQFAGDILVAGSATLVQSLIAHDLVDELHLMVFPIALGSGKRLFADGVEPTTLTLVEVKQSGTVALLTLQRER
jgi:dihydrofolate reductase